jgi:midasin
MGASTCSSHILPLRDLRIEDPESTSSLAAIVVDGEAIPLMLTESLSHSFQIASCFATSFDKPTTCMLQELARDPQIGSPSSIERTLRLLEKSTNEPFNSAVGRFVCPALRRIAELAPSTRESIANLGLAWISLSRTLLDLYVPNKPLDPAAVQSCISDLWRQEAATLSSQIYLHHRLEQRSHGNDSNHVIAHLNAHLKDALEQSHITSLRYPQNRNNLQRLHIFWAEVSQFLTQVIPPSRIDPLLLDFDSESVSRREHIIQQSISGFDKRLEDAYPEYTDIRTALQLALLYLRLGLRLMTHSVSRGSDSALAPMSRIGMALVAFPTVRGTTMLLTRSAMHFSQIDVTPQHLLLKLAAIGFEKSLGVKTECHLHVVEATYEQILRLWLIDRARESDQDLASKSLYKRNPLNHSVLSDAEAEEEEFLAMFPQFEDVLQRQDTSSRTKEGNRKILIAPSQMLLVAGIHHHLFSPATRNADSLDAFVTFDELRTLELDTLFDGCTLSLPDSMDPESRPYQLSLLKSHLSVLQGIRKSSGRPYDFYSDCNVPETTKASAIIDALGVRLDSLLREWPDQAVLQHLKSLCDSMLALDIHSPVAKILSALEQLLMQIEDWEIFANRENTLREHQSAMTGLIVEWRRLELSSWEALLRAQSRLFADGASQWWFRIYELTIRASLDVLSREEAEDFTGYLNSLTPLLDDFICSSPLGQYHARMRLLQSFASYADQLAMSKSLALQQGLKRVSRVLRTTSQYYGIFAASITRYLAEQQGIIETEIRALIKLASWKDVNVYALKQSARKTHHQLYKSVRKFRDVMRQPLAGWLQVELAGNAESEALPDHSPVSRSHAMPTFPAERFIVTPSSPLEDVSKIFQKFDTLVNSRIRMRITSSPARKVDDLAIHIISTAKTLSMARVSATSSAVKKENEQKALTVRKRKAWGDLLKELKRVGLKANVKPDILTQLRDVRWLREQPVFSDVPTSLKSIEKSETYFCRLQNVLPSLRLLLSDHHPDVSTRDLQRGIMLLESGFSLAIDARAWYGF